MPVGVWLCCWREHNRATAPAAAGSWKKRGRLSQSVLMVAVAGDGGQARAAGSGPRSTAGGPIPPAHNALKSLESRPLQSVAAVSAIPTVPTPPSTAPSRAPITAAWARDETVHVRELLEQARLPEDDRAAIQGAATDLVRRVRARALDQGAVEAFMQQYDLASAEGVLLMSVRSE